MCNWVSLAWLQLDFIGCWCFNSVLFSAATKTIFFPLHFKQVNAQTILNSWVRPVRCPSGLSLWDRFLSSARCTEAGSPPPKLSSGMAVTKPDLLSFLRGGSHAAGMDMIQQSLCHWGPCPSVTVYGSTGNQVLPGFHKEAGNEHTDTAHQKQMIFFPLCHLMPMGEVRPPYSKPLPSLPRAYSLYSQRHRGSSAGYKLWFSPASLGDE